MLDLLRAHPRTTGDLCAHFKDLDRCTVMQHLRVLEGSDLVIVKRKGRERWNYLNALPIQRIHDRWISQYAGHAMGLLSQLEKQLQD